MAARRYEISLRVKKENFGRETSSLIKTSTVKNILSTLNGKLRQEREKIGEISFSESAKSSSFFFVFSFMENIKIKIRNSPGMSNSMSSNPVILNSERTKTATSPLTILRATSA